MINQETLNLFRSVINTVALFIACNVLVLGEPASGEVAPAVADMVSATLPAGASLGTASVDFKKKRPEAELSERITLEDGKVNILIFHERVNGTAVRFWLVNNKVEAVQMIFVKGFPDHIDFSKAPVKPATKKVYLLNPSYEIIEHDISSYEFDNLKILALNHKPEFSITIFRGLNLKLDDFYPSLEMAKAGKQKIDAALEAIQKKLNDQ